MVIEAGVKPQPDRVGSICNMRNQHRIFLDMDGVLADFVGGAAKFHNKDPRLVVCWGLHKCWGMTEDQLWKPLGFDFWSNLEPTSEAIALVRMSEEVVGSDNVCILTCPCHIDGCTDGKIAWVRKYFPQFAKRLLIGGAKHFCAAPTSLLIDDSDDKVNEFVKWGGRGFLVPRPWNSASGLIGPAPTMILKEYFKWWCWSVNTES